MLCAEGPQISTLSLSSEGVGHFEHKFQGEGGHSPDSWHQMSPWAIMWCCLHDPTFSSFDTIPACDRQTHTHRQTDRHTIIIIIITKFV